MSCSVALRIVQWSWMSIRSINPFADHVPVLDGVLGDHLPRTITHDLANHHNHLIIRALRYVPWLDMRVDQVKLPPPIVTDLLVTV